MEFKDIIKTRRTVLGLRLEEIARHVGVSAATVSRWENGSIENIRRDKISSLAEILQISPSQLMGWDEKIEFTTNTEDLPNDIRYVLGCEQKTDANTVSRDYAKDKNEADMLLLARHMAPIPEEDRNALKEQFRKSVDLYLKALKKSSEEK